MHITKEEREHAEIVVSGTLEAPAVEARFHEAMAEAVREVSIPGFRKGHAPEARVLEEVGEGYVWRRAAEMALKNELPAILEKEGVVPIVPLALSLTSAPRGASVAFSVTAITPPRCDAGIYKATAEKALREIPEGDLEKEKADAVRAFRTQVRSLGKPAASESEEKETNTEGAASEKLSDEEAKRAGFENGEAIEHFMHGEAERAVMNRSAQKKRSAVAEALIANANCAIPLLLIDEEARALLSVFKRDIVEQGLEWNDYTKRVQKTEDGILADLKPQARKRIAFELIFADIIKKESLALTEEDREKEETLAHALQHEQVSHERAHAYAREQLLREKVWGVLGVKSEGAV